MKKFLFAILAIILCLGLCACSNVKQELHDVAVSSYEAMKAEYEDISAKYDVLKTKVDKYSTVIEALEKEDYDGAVDAVNAMRPVPVTVEPEYKQVVITKDNFWDYFEYREEFLTHPNSFDELVLEYDHIAYGLFLKEEYKSLIAKPSTVAVSYHADVKYEKAKINKEKETFEWTGKIVRKDTENNDIRIECSNDLLMNGYPSDYCSEMSSEGGYKRLYNIQIRRVEGSLYLKTSD